MARTKAGPAVTEGLPALKRPVLRYHGGKFRLAAWIRSFFPPHTIYVEPFGGAGSVLLTKPRAYAEVFNDMDGDVVNFFKVLRDPASRSALCEACELTPYAREEFEAAFLPTDEPIERARHLAIRAAMGFGSAGATKETTGFRIDSSRKHLTAYHDWDRYPAAVAAVGDRLKGVLIECRPAIEVMLQHDGPDTLHYVDPPYLHSTRVRASTKVLRYYKHEMTDWQHEDLITALRNLQGFVVLSGYHSELYAKRLADWSEQSTRARKSSFRGTGISTEVAWLNPRCLLTLEKSKSNIAAQ
jgi:DNA adenine methylase